MFKLKIQMNLGELNGDDPTARGLSNQIIEAMKIALKQLAVTVEVEKATCVNEQRKDGRNILSV